MYRNKEGYPDPTAGAAIKEAMKMPKHIHSVYKMPQAAAGVLDLKITGIKDRKTGKEWRKA